MDAVKKMPIAICIMLFFSVAIQGTAFAQQPKVIRASADACMQIMTFPENTTTEFDTRCEKNSILVRTTISAFGSYKNRVRICIEKRTGKWDCGGGNYENGEAASYWSCNPTGRVMVDAVVADGSEYSGCFTDYNKEPPAWVTLNFSR